jgi:hypothetical protein
VFWSRKGMRVGLWKEATQLVLVGLPMVVVAVAYRSRNLVRRRKPEHLDLDLSRFAPERSAVSTRDR